MPDQKRARQPILALPFLMKMAIRRWLAIHSALPILLQAIAGSRRPLTMIWPLVIDAGVIVRKPRDDSRQSNLSRQHQATFYQSDGDQAGGGFWGYFGVALVALVYGATRLSYVVNCALFLIIKATLAQTWWIFASWWIKAPAALFLSLVWLFLAYLALRASVEADERRARDFHLATEGAILSTAVPPDAEDPEVRRVLACAEYFSVLEVPVTADEREVKRSYKRKALRLHPDKCRDTKYAAEAFERVKLAFETLGDARARERYEAALLRAREIAAAMAREQQGEGGGAGAAGGAGPRRRPAPRSHGPKGRRRK